MRFGQIDTLVLFGGGALTVDIARYVASEKRYPVHVYTSDRQLKEPLDGSGVTFEQRLREFRVAYVSTPDVNAESTLPEVIKGRRALGIGLGEPWSFSKEILGLFDGRLLDLMGIRLPHYRGGAHYTWQILRDCKMGGCNLQMVTEDTVQGQLDNGVIVKSVEYLFPADVRTPEDYFRAANTEEYRFVREFLDEIETGVDFPVLRLQEEFSIFFPRLSTSRHGFIDWSWDLQDIDRFIRAFDSPYSGASTDLNGRHVSLRRSRVETGDGAFHPFQAGLVYRITKNGLFVCCRQGTLVVQGVYDENGISILGQIRIGDRFFTPREEIEKALLFRASYGPDGLLERT